MREVRWTVRSAWVIAALIGGVSTAPACTFPEIGFDGVGGTGGTGGAASGGTGGVSGLGGASGAGATGGSSGAGGGDGGAGGAGACDKDGDGDPAKGDMCGGGDCDDMSKLVHSGVDVYHTMAHNGSFDYDCNGLIDRDPLSDKTVSCGALNGCDTTKQGYVSSVPACGEAGEWGRCKRGFLYLCVPEILEKARTIGCK